MNAQWKKGAFRQICGAERRLELLFPLFTLAVHMEVLAANVWDGTRAQGVSPSLLKTLQ